MSRFILLTLYLILSPGLAQAAQFIGATPGNGNDGDPSTFHFASDNVDFQMSKDDGTAMTTTDVPLIYGTSIKIFLNNQDYLATNSLQAIGADLSGINWTNPDFPGLGQVAIDPATGRFKFARTWGTAERISPAIPRDMQLPRISVTGEGEAVCGYYTDSYVGYVQNYSMQNGWQAAEEIIPRGLNVRTGASAQGFAFGVLQNNGGSPARVEAYPYYPGLGWYSGVTIDAGVAGSGEFVHLNDFAMNANNQAFCSFAEGVSNLTLRGYVTRYTDQAGWEPAVIVDDGPRRLFELRVATCNSGTAAAIMRQYNGSSVEHVYANIYTGGSWQGATQLSTQTPAGNENIAISDSGYIIAVYRQWDGIAGRATANIYIPGSNWQSTQYIDTATGDDINGPIVAINSSGTGFCVYRQYDGSSLYRIYANRYVPGIGWEGAVLIDTNPTYGASSPQIVMYDNGEAVCFYKSYDGSRTRLYSTRYLPGSGWQGPVAINTAGTVSLDAYTAASVNTEVMWVAFENIDPAYDQVFANRFASEIPFGILRTNHYSLGQAVSTPIPTETSVQITNRKIYLSRAEKVQIQYAITESGRVSIRLYDLQGRLVRVLVEESLNPGIYQAEWSGNNSAGQWVASGVYIMHVKGPGINEKQKVVVIK